MSYSGDRIIRGATWVCGNEYDHGVELKNPGTWCTTFTSVFH